MGITREPYQYLVGRRLEADGRRWLVEDSEFLNSTPGFAHYRVTIVEIKSLVSDRPARLVCIYCYRTEGSHLWDWSRRRRWSLRWL